MKPVGGGPGRSGVVHTASPKRQFPASEVPRGFWGLLGQARATLRNAPFFRGLPWAPVQQGRSYEWSVLNGSIFAGDDVVGFSRFTVGIAEGVLCSRLRLLIATGHSIGGPTFDLLHEVRIQVSNRAIAEALTSS